MAKDPVCGMRVLPENAADKKTYMGKTFFFCSRKCGEEFLKNPEYHLLTQFDKNISYSRKIAVVGTGQVGATFAFALMISSLSSEIVLIDADHQRAVGHAMDLNHGLPFAEPTKIQPGGYEDCRGADIVVITAGNFAIALGLTRILSAILRDENSALSVSSLVDNYYGISDVCLSIPSLLNQNGIYRHLNMTLDQNEAGMLRGSAGVLQEVLRQFDI